MPKYVFEISLTLAADEELTVSECNTVTRLLQEQLASVAAVFGKRGGRISAEPPFEQVTGDWTPPDENGFLHPTGSRPIDL
jgi:hypothetical protein